MTTIAARNLTAALLISTLLGCSATPPEKSIESLPSVEVAPIPNSTPAPIGTTQSVRVNRDTTLLMTPMQIDSRLVSDTANLGNERFYVSVYFRIESLGPAEWRPLDERGKEQRQMCLDLRITSDAEVPLCNVLYSSPQFEITTGPWWPCSLSLGNDPLRWEMEPKLSLKPLSAGAARSGWLTWCVEEKFDGVNLEVFREDFVLRTVGVFGLDAEWRIGVFP